MTNEKVSVILPAYNVEKYIWQCLESIAQQSYDNIEIIVIDDGSSDDTYEIAKKFAEKDSRVLVLTQKNAGSGPARNKGLQIASGKYVMFVDPDDWIDSNMIMEFMRISNESNPDIITTGYIEEYENGKNVSQRIFRLPDLNLDNQNQVRENYIALFLSEAICAPTRILYKKSIIDKYKIEFPPLRRSQDIVFNYRYYDKVTTLVSSSRVYYHYRINSGSYMQKFKSDYYKTLELIYTDIEMYQNRWNVKISKETEQRFINRFFVLIAYYIESAITQKFSYDDVFYSDCLNEIAEKASPIDLYHKLLKKAYIARNRFSIHCIVGVKIFTRKYLKGIFECFRKVKKY